MPIIIIGMAHVVMKQEKKKKHSPTLKKSAARKVIDAYRYLGKLYYDIYRFDDAVDNYEQHIEWLEKKKKRPTEMAEAELEQIKQAARMIKRSGKHYCK